MKNLREYIEELRKKKEIEEREKLLNWKCSACGETNPVGKVEDLCHVCHYFYHPEDRLKVY